MFVVGDKKLATIGIGPTVCHRYNATLGVLERVNNFIRKLPVRSRKDAFAAFASPCGITALRRKPSSLKNRTIVEGTLPMHAVPPQSQAGTVCRHSRHACITDTIMTIVCLLFGKKGEYADVSLCS